MAARSSNWTKEETEILVDGYVANREVLFGKFSSTITNEEKEKTFCAILESINAVGCHGRSIEDLKSKWKQLKCRTVAKARKNHKEVQKTGGGEPVKGLNTVQEKVLSCVPKVVLDGLKGNDTGPIVNPENDRFTASQTDLESQAVADEEVVSKPKKKKQKTSVESCQCSAELLEIQKKLLEEAVRSNALNQERNLFLEKMSSSLSVLATKQYSDNLMFEL